MSASAVNAYSPYELVKVGFPAAMLQPQFFDPEADAARSAPELGTRSVTSSTMEVRDSTRGRFEQLVDR
jgi:hypothetical protein